MSDVYLNFINGQWKQGSSGQWDENRNPAKPSELIGKATRSTPIDIDRAIDAAQKAQGEWARMPRPKRGAILAKAATLLKGKLETFAKTITREEGKNLAEARGEVQKAINCLEFTAGESRRPTGQVIPSEVPGTMIYTTRAPLGVVAVITPWNFPVCIPVWKIAAALVEGNSVLFKPASNTPASATLLVRLFEEAGVPAGVLNLVYGSGSQFGQVITNDARVRGISFTGSNEVGAELNQAAAKTLKRVQLELGGKNALIVCADADLDAAVDATVMGAFGSTGQRCTATSRVIVEKPVAQEFTQKLLTKVRTLRVGDGFMEGSPMGPVVDEKSLTSLIEAIEAAKKEGAHLLCGGERVGAPGPDTGHFLAPTIFGNVTSQMKLAQEELFGPVLAILESNSFEESLALANQVRFGLTSSLYTRDIARALAYADRIETGMLHINSPTVGGEAQAPFGGMKQTGLGRREMGASGPEFFSELKTVYLEATTGPKNVGNLY
jgi:acyl-CoA reductase-like NAD-dependent aldehyde dehydrogenase